MECTKCLTEIKDVVSARETPEGPICGICVAMLKYRKGLKSRDLVKEPDNSQVISGMRWWRNGNVI
jgi:hypothetical protein